MVITVDKEDERMQKLSVIQIEDSHFNYADGQCTDVLKDTDISWPEGSE